MGHEECVTRVLVTVGSHVRAACPSGAAVFLTVSCDVLPAVVVEQSQEHNGCYGGACDEVHAVHTGDRVFIRIQACIYRGWNIVGRYVGYAYWPADDIARIKAHGVRMSHVMGLIFLFDVIGVSLIVVRHHGGQVRPWIHGG